MNPAWWIPIVVLDYFIGAWLTFKISGHGDMKWFWVSWLAGFPLWMIIARYSKDVVRDGLIFDVTMTLVYTLSILYFTKSYLKFGINQYWGLMLVLFGLMIFKRGT